MKTYSQSKQDLFALLVNPNPGFFIDVASSVPDWQSNSKLLLEKGWHGVCVDIQDHSNEWIPYPNAKFIKHDATTINWRELIEFRDGVRMVDYASIDVDFFTYDTLKNLFMHGIAFKCATIEHDAYRFGDTLRQPERMLMEVMGYRRILSDVGHSGFPYEDWYLHPSVQNWEEITTKAEQLHA